MSGKAGTQEGPAVGGVVICGLPGGGEVALRLREPLDDGGRASGIPFPGDQAAGGNNGSG